MTDETELLRKLLALDPASNIFHLLAARLSQKGDYDEAVAVLRQGLAVHPEHMQGRLLLAETLCRAGHSEDALAEARLAMESLASYPSFWRMWAEKADGEGAVLTQTILAALLLAAPNAWNDLLRVALDVRNGVAAAAPAEPGAPPAKAAARRAPRPQASEPLDAAPVTDAAARVRTEEPAAPLPRRQPAQRRGARSGDPLRTRTMAEILAAQGDAAGAIDIYEELLAAAVEDEERTELAVRLEALRRSPREAPPPSVPRLGLEGLAEAEAHGRALKAGDVVDLDDVVELDAAMEIAPAPEPQPAPNREAAAEPKAVKAAKTVSLLERLAARLERRAAG